MSIIKATRERKGLSQEHLAAQAGIGLRTVQRAEAGERIAAENLLALCAVLGLTPEQVVPDEEPSVSGATLPQVGMVRRALDRALAEAGENPVWRLPDPTPRLCAALANMGEAADERGFRNAIDATVLRSRGASRFGVAAILLGLLAFWMATILLIETFFLAVPSLRPARLQQFGFPTWLAFAFPILLAILCTVSLRSLHLGRLISPGKGDAILRKGLIESDLYFRDLALTRDALWVASVTENGLVIRRTGLDLLKGVDFAEGGDGANSIILDVGKFNHRVDRLSDSDLRFLRRRFGTRSVREWTVAPA